MYALVVHKTDGEHYAYMEDGHTGPSGVYAIGPLQHSAYAPIIEAESDEEAARLLSAILNHHAATNDEIATGERLYDEMQAGRAEAVR